MNTFNFKYTAKINVIILFSIFSTVIQTVIQKYSFNNVNVEVTVYTA